MTGNVQGAANVCDDVVVPTIVFRPLEAEDFPAVVGWFAEPAIAQWWNEPAELASVESKYGPRIRGCEPTLMWIVEIEGLPAGLLQCYHHVDYPEHDERVGIPDAVGIDYLIGDAHRGRGLGAGVLRAFAAHALGQHPSLMVCAATPAQENPASWRSHERAGFTRYRQCQPPNEPIAFVYAVTRSELADVAQSGRP